MVRRKAAVILAIVLLQLTLAAASFSRQKRCIVIQKQSGTHGDSAEGEEDRDIEPRKPDRRTDGHDRRNAERLPPDSEFLRYKIGPTKRLDDAIRYKNTLTSLKNRFLY